MSATYTPGNTNIDQTTVTPKFLAYLDRSQVMKAWTNRKYEGDLRNGSKTVDVPVMNDMNPITNGTAGGTIAVQDTAVTKVSITVTQVEKDNRPITNIEEVISNYPTVSLFLCLPLCLSMCVCLAHCVSASVLCVCF